MQGNVLTRKEQLPLVSAETSEGIFAPTIRYHDGVFYVITTNVTPTNHLGNFIVTAKDPAGPWSDPYPLDAAGIDSPVLDREASLVSHGYRRP